MAEYKPRFWWRVPLNAGVNNSVKIRVKVGGTEHPSGSTWQTITVAADGSLSTQWTHVERLLYRLKTAVNTYLATLGYTPAPTLTYAITDAGLVSITLTAGYELLFNTADSPTVALTDILALDAIGVYANSFSGSAAHAYGYYPISATVTAANDEYVRDAYVMTTVLGAPVSRRAEADAHFLRLAYTNMPPDEVDALKTMRDDLGAGDLTLITASGAANYTPNYKLDEDSLRRFAPERMSPGLELYSVNLNLVHI